MTAKKHDRQDEHADGIVEDRKQAPPAYFNILFYGLILWGVIFSGYYLLSGWSSTHEFENKMAAYEQTYTQSPSTQTPAAQENRAAAADKVDAAALFSANCASCHGSGGAGGFATDLTGDYAYGKDVESIRTSIAQGRGEMMPGFAESLSEQEITALSRFLLEL